MVDDIAIKDFVEAIKPEEKNKETKYAATVSRVDSEGVVWVFLPGSDKETPTASTASEVKQGDVVTVEWRNNKLYIAGNYSNPSAGYNSVKPSVEFVESLVDKDITVKSITAATGYIDDLYSKNITTENLQASTGYIKDLNAENITTNDIKANTGYIKSLVAQDILADDIIADHAAVGSLDANYAKINAANITDLTAQNAWIDALMVQTGLIAHAGSVFELDAIQVNASKIKTGTLDVERLIVSVPDEKDPTKIHKYMVHVDPSTGNPSYEKVDADVLEDLTITADKIVAEAITAEKITTENIVGSGGWINLRNGTFNYNNASTGNYISWDGKKLRIQADEFLLSSGKSIFEEMEAIETWFYATAPTASNEPAKNWTTDKLKELHLRDIYFDTNSGKSYRWAKEGTTYKWVEIEDKELSALAGRVSKAETAIESNSEAITLRATKNEAQGYASTAEKNAKDDTANKLTNYYTKTETDSAITTKAGEISLSVAEKQVVAGLAKIDGLYASVKNSGDNLIYEATFIQGGEDITNTIPAGNFEWYYVKPTYKQRIGSGRTLTVPRDIIGSTVECCWTKRDSFNITDHKGNDITDHNGNALMAYIEVA